MKQLEKSIIEKAVKRYLKTSMLILIGLTLVSLAFMNILQQQFLNEIIISLAFNAVISILYIYLWQLIMKHSRESFLHFYLGGTGLRLITAFFTVFIYRMFTDDLSLCLTFAVVFCIYYMVMLIFDTLFFAKFERTNLKNS